jgi:hypothetical protein
LGWQVYKDEGSTCGELEICVTGYRFNCFLNNQGRSNYYNSCISLAIIGSNNCIHDHQGIRAAFFVLFLCCRRTKAVFTMALNVHKEIQRRDISVGRNIGNRILRMLDHMRPQANIRGPPTEAINEAPKPEAQVGKKGEFSKDPIKSNLQGATSTAESKPVNPPYRAFVAGQYGQSIGSGFSGGLSRLAPQMTHQSLPVVMGLWWQPVRKNMEFLREKDSSLQVRLPELGFKGSFPPAHGLAPGRSLLRADISAWMQKPHQM